MEPLTLPAVFESADLASLKAQKTYLWLFRGTLLLLIVGAFLGSVSSSSPSWQHTSRLSSAIILGVSVLLGVTLKLLAPEKSWFGARAVAESVKSVSWRYAVGGEPFAMSVEARAADERFNVEVRTILNAKRDLGWNFATVTGGPQITPEMRAWRGRSMPERLQLYIEKRVKKQRQWYGDKATGNGKRHLAWFGIATFAQIAAVISAIVMIQVTNGPINPTGAFSAISAAAVAWSQMKRHQDLAQSYGLAAHELGLIEGEAEHVKTESDLSAFVANAENAISREHTMWAARRDVG
jgi:hypothetical protein